jgi:uncharacterized membrane protein YebE (DUF533 family)
MKKPDVSIGKFDILATYTYAKALLDGADDADAKERGMVAAIMGAKAKLGYTTHRDYQDDKQAAEKKKKKTITAESFDRQVADKMGSFFDEIFLSAIKELVAAHKSYEDVKRLVKFPTTWGAKITGEQFKERAVPPRPSVRK